MCTRPRLLCLDEPAAGLNPRETADLSQLLKSIRDEQDVSILLIEHDMGMVMGDLRPHRRARLRQEDRRRPARGGPQRRGGDQGLSRRARGGGAAARGGGRPRRAKGRTDAAARGRPHLLRQHRGAEGRQRRRRAGPDRHHHRLERRRQVDPPDDHLRQPQGRQGPGRLRRAATSPGSPPTTSSISASASRPRAAGSSRG